MVKWSARLAVMGSLLLAGAGPLLAQTPDPAALLSRIEFLERQVRILGERTGGPASDPRSAVAADGAGAGSPAAARLSVRITELEQEMQAITGRVEEMGFQIRRLNERLDRMAADVEYRLGPQPGGAATGPVSARPPAPLPPQDVAGTPPSTLPRDPAAGSAATAGGAPRVLGNLPGAEAEKSRPPRSETPAVLPVPPPAGERPAPPEQPSRTTSREQYAYAFSLMQKEKYADAQKAFQEFLDRHPTDGLAENASYWLGESYYAQGDYSRAASTFLSTYEKHKTGAKAPDTLLKLGMSLGQLKKNREACATFQELSKAFPGAPTAVKSKAAEERKRLGCT